LLPCGTALPLPFPASRAMLFTRRRMKFVIVFSGMGCFSPVVLQTR